MSGGDGDDRRFDEEVAEALRSAAAEARPRPEFARDLRERFAAGDLAPSPAALPPRPAVLGIPRWIAYPAAAAILGAAFALSGALGPRAVVDDPLPLPAGRAALDRALADASRRIERIPGLAGRAWQRRILDGRPWLLPAEVAAADGVELRTLAATMAAAEAAAAKALPAAAARPAPAVVTLVVPSREVFASLVAPRIAPMELEESTVAFAVPDPGVLLLSPEALLPGGPPCEAMDVAHEAVHAWLRERTRPGHLLPLWVDEGLAAVIGQEGALDTRAWCRGLLGSLRGAGVDPLRTEEVLSLRTIPEMVELIASRAICEERPHALVAAFYAHADSLVLFLADERPEAFRAWLGEVLDGKTFDAAATAKALGFESPAALAAARDAWLE